MPTDREEYFTDPPTKTRTPPTTTDRTIHSASGIRFEFLIILFDNSGNTADTSASAVDDISRGNCNVIEDEENLTQQALIDSVCH